MEEKSEYGKYAVELTASNGKVYLPTGFLESQELWLKLQELFFPVAHHRDFYKLSVGLRWNMLTDTYITLTTNAMHYDFIKKDVIQNSPQWIGGAGLTLGYMLPIGPFRYSVLYAGKGAGCSTCLNVGFPFKPQ